jgi:methyltransferase (TIGR00027 family)
MLRQLKRIVYPVADLAAAKAWYSEVLGTTPLLDVPFAAIFPVGHCSLSLRPVATADPAPETGLEVYWEVEDVEAALEFLIGKGARLHTPVQTLLRIRTAKIIDPFGNVLGLTDQGPRRDSRPLTERPSETAVNVALCRALAARDKRPGMKGPDNLAEVFLEEQARDVLRTTESRQWAAQRLAMSGLYGYLWARTAYGDAVFREQCAQRIPQVVLLGAGYDTRAIRFQDGLRHTRVFELDLSTTQTRKRERLDGAGVTQPDGLVYVPFNFETDNLADVLARAGYDPARRTLFIWEGVLYYLTKSAVVATLQRLVGIGPSGSVLVLDCLRTELESVNPGEPFHFWISPDELTPLLADFGWQATEILDAGEMAKRFLTLADGTQAEPCLPYFFFLRATRR